MLLNTFLAEHGERVIRQQQLYAADILGGLVLNLDHERDVVPIANRPVGVKSSLGYLCIVGTGALMHLAERGNPYPGELDLKASALACRRDRILETGVMEPYFSRNDQTLIFRRA